MKDLTAITEHKVKVGEHTTRYLAAGPERGPLMIFVHGWPDLAIGWRDQLTTFAGLGFRTIAPDMRGYGKSTQYTRHEDYAQEQIVVDMLDLIDVLDRERAIWIGHDWGTATVWNIASHHPERCYAVANLCVPYMTLERGLNTLVGLVDRSVYPENEYPLGQWDYQNYQQYHFERSQAVLEANVVNTFKAIFRAGDPADHGKPFFTAELSRDNGWFCGADEAPDMPLDTSVLSEDILQQYVDAFEQSGFFGPDSYYLNHAANEQYANKAKSRGRLDMPVLFLSAKHDYVLQCAGTRLTEPMRQNCSNLTEYEIATGHWMTHEKPFLVNAKLADWLVRFVSESWPELI